MKLRVVSSFTCPVCGAEEMHGDGDKLLIRAFKVAIKGQWHSQCLVCSGYYDKDHNITEENHDPKKGWFV